MSSSPVVCAACGARMKANRRSCLRCGEALIPVEAVQAAPQGPRHFSQRTTVAIGVTSSIVVIALTGVLWKSNTSAEPARADTSTRAVTPAAPGTPAVSQPNREAALIPDAAAFVDAKRGGGAAFLSGDFDAARAKYEEALAKRPDDPDALNNLGQALVRLGRVDEGIARFERALVVAPDAWAPHFNLAAAEAQRGQWDRAIDQYREAARVFPEDYATQFNLALALHKKGDEPAAITAYERAIQLAPSEPSFHSALAVSLEKIGRVEDAVREYRVTLDMDPASADAGTLKTHVDALSQGLRTAR